MEAFIEFLEQEIKKYSYDDNYIERMISTLNNIREYTGDKEIKLIYPQNVFLDRQDSKFYVFLEDYIIIGSCNKYNSTVEILKGKDVERIERIKDNETKNLILRIHFYSGQLVTLNNNLDADREHVGYLKEQIEKVIKCVLNYKG